jgi:outer membrane protein OmpA-like peptidoglycan-associated protein
MIAIVCVISCFFLLTIIFAANYETPTINKFGQTGLIYSHSAKTLGFGRLNIGILGNVSRNDDFLRSIHMIGDTIFIRANLPDRTIGNVNFNLGYGITRWLDFGAMLPVYMDKISGENDYGIGGTIAAVGDLEVSLKWQYPPHTIKNFFEMAYYGAVCIPTGDKADGYFPRHTYYFLKEIESELMHYYTSGNAEVDIKMLWTFNFGQLFHGAPVKAFFNYGFRWTDADLDHLFLLNMGLKYHPINWLTLFTEYSSEIRFGNVDRGFKVGDDPLRLSPGITLTPPGGFYLTMGMDINLSSSETTLLYNTTADNNLEHLETEIEPQYRFVMGIGWAGFIMPQDKDKDGIKDNEDRCPEDPEDYDGFEDHDGCPEHDNDKDGIPDTLDKCPNDPEDKDGFEDEDGCPDDDNDGDGIKDVDDKCPNVAEDIDGFEDEDGCPDYDNDKDGIPDSVDACINKPEDKDGHDDTDGCPDFDNDLDGIPDSTDKCPNDPETYNGFEDEDGCPDKVIEKPKAKEIKRGRVILRGVNFEFNKATLKQESFSILEQVYASLTEWPEIRVEIIGHTDSIGSKMYNRRLSKKRAETVRDYLISKGITSDRLVALGKGEDEPIATNKTEDGRATNRRVELHRID